MKIREIREKIKQNNIDAYVIAHGNRFIGQDILESEHKLKALCGFSGSAGASVGGTAVGTAVGSDLEPPHPAIKPAIRITARMTIRLL